MFGLSIAHWIIVLVLVLIFFGKEKLPRLSKSMGEAIRNYKNAVNEIEVPQNQVTDDENLVAKQKSNNQARYQKQKPS